MTHARGLHSLSAAHSLSRRGIEVIGCDEAPLSLMAFSKHVMKTFVLPSMEDEPEAYLDALVEQVERWKPPPGVPYVLMPIHRHTRWIARHRDRLEPLIRIASAEERHIDRVFPKDRLMETAREFDVPAPPTWIIADPDELTSHLDEIQLPAILKIPDGAGAKGLEKVETKEDMLKQCRNLFKNYVKEGGRLLVQEMVDGEDYCVTTLFARGRLRAYMTYRNLQTFPDGAGFGILRETVDAPPLIEAACRLMEPLEWHGVAQIDYRWSGENGDTPWLIEVNPRFWGGLFQSIESGIDYPWLLYRMTVDGDVPPADPPTIGVRTRIPVLGLVSAIEHCVENQSAFSALGDAWKKCRRELAQGSVLQGLRELVTGIDEAMTLPLDFTLLSERLREYQEARPELLSTDDSYAPLGVLYVLAHIARHGKVPEELR